MCNRQGSVLNDFKNCVPKVKFVEHCSVQEHMGFCAECEDGYFTENSESTTCYECEDGYYCLNGTKGKCNCNDCDKKTGECYSECHETYFNINKKQVF